MPNFNIVRRIKPSDSFRVNSIKGQFDLSLDEVEERFTGDIDIDGADWNIGLIYGASGTGKTTIATELFGEGCVSEYEYKEKSIIDDMPKSVSTEDISKSFNSVGFSTVWSWLKPYSVLSTGEKMRVNLSRALLSDAALIVFDEFTSVVNREVAKAGSYAISKAIRKQKKKFIAVSCHDDIVEWLGPDWTLCTDNMEFSRRSVRRPEIKLDIYPSAYRRWATYRKYHYMSEKLNKAARCYVAKIGKVAVAFAAVLHLPHWKSKNLKRLHRMVVLPDYQGLGIGHKFNTFLAGHYKGLGFRYVFTSSSKAMLNSIIGDRNWVVRSKKRGMAGAVSTVVINKTASKRYTFSYEYVG